MPPKAPYTIGSTAFEPDAFFTQWSSDPTPPTAPDLRSAILKAFSISTHDSYIYHAHASVTLAQVQQAIDAGRSHGLHDWYRDAGNKPLPPPPQSDIQAYTALYSPSTVPSKALSTFHSNARKSSLRFLSASLLTSRRLLPSSLPTPRNKAHVNPSLAFHDWACRELEWVGPVPDSASEGKAEEATGVKMKTQTSHPVLPVLMHHFGCVCPSWESLSLISSLATHNPNQTASNTDANSSGSNRSSKGQSREIYDIGSGNGYWTYLLRRLGLTAHAIDNGDSEWRTMWIGDTIKADGAEWLRRHAAQQSKKGVRQDLGILLLVYPITSASFTERVIDAYAGNTVVVAGTGNRSGYTAFRDVGIEEWMLGRGKEGRGAWKVVVRVGLPSFPGKDEVLFVFEREGTGKTDGPKHGGD